MLTVITSHHITSQQSRIKIKSINQWQHPHSADVHIYICTLEFECFLTLWHLASLIHHHHGHCLARSHRYCRDNGEKGAPLNDPLYNGNDSHGSDLASVGMGASSTSFDPPSIKKETDAAARDKGCGDGAGGLTGDEYCAVVRRSTL